MTLWKFLGDMKVENSIANSIGENLNFFVYTSTADVDRNLL